MSKPYLHHWARASVIALAVSQLCAPGAWAATEAERIAELEKKLERSLSLIDRLAARVQELEKPAVKAMPASTAAPTATEQADRIETLERNVAQMAESGAKSSAAGLGVPLHGFADVGYVSSGQSVADGRKSGFALGSLSFYLTPDMGDRVKSLVELVFEYGADGHLATDLERLQVGYTVSDALTLWAGRFHTPYGYWNTAFHHGGQFQTAITRPKMIAFEDQGGFLPSHTVGLWGTGQFGLGQGKLGYDLYLSNGNSMVDGVQSFNAVRADNGNMRLGGNLRYSFNGTLDGLTLGAHAFSETVNEYAGGVGSSAPLSSTKVNMTGLYGVYDRADWEVIGEYYNYNNTDTSGTSGSHSSWAGFVQVGKLVAQNFTPYVRLEKAVLDQTDNYFLSQHSGRSYQRQTLGLRYDINPKTALKLELNRTGDETASGRDDYSEARLQLAVRF